MRDMHDVTVTILEGHNVRIEPLIPALVYELAVTLLNFRKCESRGIEIVRGYVPESVSVTHRDNPLEKPLRIDQYTTHWIPLGLLPLTTRWLRARGYAVEIRDRRTDSARWIVDEESLQASSPRLQRMIRRIAEHRCLRLVGIGDAQRTELIASLAQAYQKANIAIGYMNPALVSRLQKKLQKLSDETIGLCTKRVRSIHRVTVGLVRDMANSNPEGWDLLVLPDAEGSLGVRCLDAILSGYAPRLLSFSRTHQPDDPLVWVRMQMLADTVWPAAPEATRPTVYMLPVRPSAPCHSRDIIEQKRIRYWGNHKRNRLIAELARRLGKARPKPLIQMGFDDREVECLQIAARSPIAILVESLEHARHLERMLPGWVLRHHGQSMDDERHPVPTAGLILTERTAIEQGICAGILIRATGTSWPLPPIRWYYERDDGLPPVLIDFRDRGDESRISASRARRESYRGLGWPVTDIRPSSHLHNNGTTGVMDDLDGGAPEYPAIPGGRGATTPSSPDDSWRRVAKPSRKKCPPSCLLSGDDVGSRHSGPDGHEGPL